MRLLQLLLLTAVCGAAEDAFRAALAQAPGVIGAQARVEAARRSARGAGVLPDPMLSGDIGRKQANMGDDMTMYGAMLGQSLPRWGEREAMRLKATAQVELAEAEFADTIGDHAATIALAAAEAAAATATVTLLTDSAVRVRTMHEVVLGRVAAGNAMIGEPLALETRAQSLELQIADQRRRIIDAESEARGRLGLTADKPIPTVTYPDPAAIDPDRVPMARRAKAMHSDALAMEREATSRANPETAFGLRWEREAAGTTEQTDTYSVSLTVSLPVWRQSYAEVADGARASARAARHEAGATGWMARSQISAAVRAIALAAQARSTADMIASRARSEYDAVIRQVGTGATPVTSALDLLDRVTEAQMQAIEAELSSRMALAGLWRLAPPELTGEPAHGQDAHATSGKAHP